MKKLSRFLVVALAIAMLVLPMAGYAAGEPFVIAHRSDESLSMADPGFIKAQCVRTETATDYELTLYVQPISKKILFTTYWADITEIKVNIGGNLVSATPHGEKDPVNDDPNQVPVYFTITVPKTAAFMQNITINGTTYPKHLKIWFETNLEHSGGLGVVGDAMMNRNARYAF